MTKWQWSVVIALCKLVLRMLQVGTANTILFTERKLLEEAVEREKENAT